MSIIKTLSDPNISAKILEDMVNRCLLYHVSTLSSPYMITDFSIVTCDHYYKFLVLKNSGAPNYLKLYLYYSL